MDNETQAEIKDIVEMITRFVVANKHDVAFVGSFVAFDEKGDVKNSADLMLAYGDLEILRITISNLRDMIEDEVDEEGFVNI